ncbi:LacI family DNA-binding transcriptional regulator [Roseibium sp. SCP14]|uniref:LacI family DNA-binding transcriptional regulator n=1 Tax=Roseibium sp. SCP14 TaxID=3141375 RepID=UPI00333DF26C
MVLEDCRRGAYALERFATVRAYMSSGIKLIAERANVSISTVSHVLNGTAPISEGVQERVLSVARDTGYLAKRKRKASISLLPTVLLVACDATLPKSDRNLVAWTMINAFRNECRARGIRIIPHIEPGSEIDPENVATAIAKHNPNGIAVMQDDRPVLIDRLHELGPEIVVLSGQDPSMRVDTVSPGNQFGACLATRYLFSLGHTRIGHLTWGQRLTTRQRMYGFIDAHRERGLKVHDDAIIDVGDYQQHVVEKNMDRWIETAGPKLPFTALFCAADNAAIGAMNSLRKAGYRIPEDISVMGFDNALFGEFQEPPLTTMHVPMEEIGHVALNLLEEALTLPKGARSPRRVELGCRLIERKSTAPLARG